MRFIVKIIYKILAITIYSNLLCIVIIYKRKTITIMVSIKDIRRYADETYPVYTMKNGEWVVSKRISSDEIPSKILRKIYEQQYEIYQTKEGMFVQCQNQGAKYFIERNVSTQYIQEPSKITAVHEEAEKRRLNFMITVQK